MMTRDQAQKLAEKILSYSKFPDCSLTINETEEVFVRFANNGITTAGFTTERTVNISSTRDRKTGISRTSDFDDASLKATVARSEELSAISPVNEESVEPLG